MARMKVALVPFDNTVKIDAGELKQVAGALGRQVHEDVRKVWHVSADVTHFESLEEALPSGHFLVVLMGAPLPQNHHGFHLAMDGRPFALVRVDNNWTLSASHELIEMVCDPSGQRTIPGESLVSGQGTVDYLVEISDPCGKTSYSIDGVTVSDFVTPAYYSGEEGRQLSCQDKIAKPRQVLRNGYLSWRTRQPIVSVWQKIGPTSSPKRLGTSSRGTRGSDSLARVARDWVDSRPPINRNSGKARASASGGSRADSAAEFRKDILDLVRYLKSPPPSLSDVIKLIERARQGHKPTATDLAKLRIPQAGGLNGRTLDTVLEALRRQEKVAGLFGPDLLDPDFGSWLLRLMP